MAVTALGAACGGDDGGSGDGGDGGEDGSASGKTIAFVGYGDTNQWAAHFNQVFGDALDAEGVEVQDLTTMDPATAVTNFNQAIAGSPDLIVTALLDTTAMVVPIQKAEQAGIPVLVFDGRPDPAVEDAVMQVLSDNVSLGKFAAQNIIEGLKAQGKDSGNVIVITGTASSLVTQDRMDGFNEEMAAAPQYKVIEIEDGNWDPTLSGQLATQLLAKHGCDGVQAAYGMADYMALPVIAAAKQAGCEVAGANGLVVTSSNCFKAGIDAIKEGSLYGTATEDPGTIAEATADYIVRFLSGEEPPQVETVPSDRVTADNVSEFAEQCSHA
ncbi:ABC transporter substrate-binding protein [Nocardioides szechwanensis]|nr:ABC transporter substrate-binding protein [Nocardioides szechwanensis]